MKILTDGTNFLDARTHESDSERAEADVYGPVESTLGVGQRVQWWGRFEASSELALEVRARPGARFEVEWLDQDFRPLAHGCAREPHYVGRAWIARATIAYLRIVNLEPRPLDVCITCTSTGRVAQPAARRDELAARRARPARLLAWARRAAAALV